MARTGHDLDPEAATRATAFIRANLPLTEVPGTGVLLHLAGPRSGLARLVPPGETPYWAHAWPGGVALAMHVVANPGLFDKQIVVEMGAGSGLVTIAAARAGGRVTAVDIDPLAAVAVRLNAEANGVADRLLGVITGPKDQPLPLGAVDDLTAHPIILAGDVFYDEAVADRATASLDAQPRHALVLVGDIGRRFLPRDRLEPLARYLVRDVGDPPSAPLREGWVHRWKRP